MSQAPQPAKLGGTATAAQPSTYIIRLRDLIYSEAGIFYPDNKLHTLEERCVTRMKEVGHLSIQGYYDVLTKSPERHNELIKLLNKVTVGETFFFRNQPQLDAFRKIVLPKIVEAQAKSVLKFIRIWSAGCSTGEEPYTLAMILLEESQGLMKGLNFEIQASDLNENSLEHARKGLYGDYSTRNLTPYYKQKYFTECSGSLQVKPLLQSKIKFSRVNLQDAGRMLFMKGMDVIFCCNVLIYFDVASKKMAIEHFQNSLLPHGYLFLGHSESLYGISDAFRLVHMPSATAYVKAESTPGKKGVS
jgi:chemotaxis protein methyltransferase CheR